MRKVPLIDTKPFEVYLDLDGVFADFEGRVKLITGKHPHEMSSNSLWKAIHRDTEFFYNLEFMENAHILWEYTKQYSPKFLTGLPSGRGSKEQKIRWVAEKFGTEHETIVLPKREKQLHSGPNKVLIDDTRTNINEWVLKGGHGIFHKGDVWKTIDAMEELRLAYVPTEVQESEVSQTLDSND